MDVDECNGRIAHTALRLDYRQAVGSYTSASRAISAVAELLVTLMRGYRCCSVYANV